MIETTTTLSLPWEAWGREAPVLGVTVGGVTVWESSGNLTYLSVHENSNVGGIGFARRCGRHFVRSAHTAARSVSQGIWPSICFANRLRYG